MPKKTPPPKQNKQKQPLTIRVSEDDRENIQFLQSALADDVRPALNMTEAITSALRIARKSLSGNVQ